MFWVNGAMVRWRCHDCAKVRWQWCDDVMVRYRDDTIIRWRWCDDVTRHRYRHRTIVIASSYHRAIDFLRLRCLKKWRQDFLVVVMIYLSLIYGIRIELKLKILIFIIRNFLGLVNLRKSNIGRGETHKWAPSIPQAYVYCNNFICFKWLDFRCVRYSWDT